MPAQPRILIVEDELILAEDIRSTLLALGYGVSDIVVSGEEAVRKAEEMRPDLVLMDIRHQLETRLKENERWLDTTLRSIGDGVIGTDAAGRVTFMNPVAEDLNCARDDGHFSGRNPGHR